MNSMTHRALATIALSTCTVLGLGLTACSSDKSSSATTENHNVNITDPGVTTTVAKTTVPKSTTTTAATPTTPAPTTPAPSGPKVNSLTANTSPNCDEVSSAGYQLNVAWVASGAASVNLSIDGPGVYQSGLPASGNLDIPGSCGDTQVVMITPIASNGTSGTPKTITIVVGS